MWERQLLLEDCRCLLTYYETYQSFDIIIMVMHNIIKLAKTHQCKVEIEEILNNNITKEQNYYG